MIDNNKRIPKTLCCGIRCLTLVGTISLLVKEKISLIGLGKQDEINKDTKPANLTVVKLIDQFSDVWP